MTASLTLCDHQYSQIVYRHFFYSSNYNISFSMFVLFPKDFLCFNIGFYSHLQRKNSRHLRVSFLTKYAHFVTYQSFPVLQREYVCHIAFFLSLHSWLLVEVAPISRIMVSFFLINAELMFMMSLLIVLYKYSLYADSFNLLILHTTKNEEINPKQQYTNAKRYHHII